MVAIPKRKAAKPLVPVNGPQESLRPLSSTAAKSISTAIDALPKNSAIRSSFTQSTGIQRTVAIKRNVEESYSVKRPSNLSAKRPFILPTVANHPRPPPCETFARFNPGLAYPSNVPSAQNVIIINNDYYGGIPPKRQHPQKTDVNKMSHCQYRYYMKRLNKEQKKN